MKAGELIKLNYGRDEQPICLILHNHELYKNWYVGYRLNKNDKNNTHNKSVFNTDNLIRRY